jgi:hypothetical protein
MTTILFALTALALPHGGHGHDGDSPSLLLRLGHYLSEPEHVVPAVLGAALLATVVALLRRRDQTRR